MNEVAVKGLLKLVKTIITPDQVKDAANSLMKSAIDFKNEVEIDPEKGESQVIGITYESNNVIMTGIAVLNDQNQILRFENIRPLNEIVDNLIKKI